MCIRRSASVVPNVKSWYTTESWKNVLEILGSPGIICKQESVNSVSRSLAVLWWWWWWWCLQDVSWYSLLIERSSSRTPTGLPCTQSINVISCTQRLPVHLLTELRSISAVVGEFWQNICAHKKRDPFLGQTYEEIRPIC